MTRTGPHRGCQAVLPQTTAWGACSFILGFFYETCFRFVYDGRFFCDEITESVRRAGDASSVAAILSKLAASNKESLDWQKSIVDLMKLLNLNSSLAARKELADELHYSGDKNNWRP